MNEKEKALADYDKAILSNPKSETTYSSRG